MTRSRTVRRMRAFFVLFFLLSMLNHIKPWHWRVWEFTVVTKEYGHWFVLLGLWFVFRFWWFRRRGWSLAALVATLMFAGPVWDAWTWEETWRNELQKGLAAETPAPPLLSLKTLYFGRWEDEVEPRVLRFDEGNALDLDFYPATAADGKPAPWVVVIHGGSWANGNSRQLPQLNSYLARRGYAVAAINYRKAPANKWPAPRDDARAAIAFLKSRAGELGLDANSYFLLGRSAGGQIALVTAYSTPDPALRGVISYYAPTDQTFGYEVGEEDDLLGSRPLMRNYMGGTPYELPEVYREASPLEWIDRSNVPTLLLHGRPDPLVWFKHSERLAARLRTRGTKVAHVESWSATHGSDYNFVGPAGQVFTNSVEYFLNVLR